MTCKLTGKISPVGILAGTLQDVGSLSASLRIKITDDLQYPTYNGPTEFAPSNEQQIIDTSGKVVLESITINPIPTNYGLITWNGVTLTVS